MSRVTRYPGNGQFYGGVTGRQRFEQHPVSPYGGSAIAFSPDQLGSLVQRFADEPIAPYYASLVDNYPVLTPEEPGTVAQPQPGACWLFDANNDLAQASYTVSGTGDFTLAAWVKVTDVTVENPIVATYGSDNNTGFELFIFLSKLKFFNGNGSVTITGATTLTNNTWYHVAVTRIAGVVTLYLNAVVDGSGSAAGSMSAAQNIRVGKGYTGTATIGGSLKGVLIDDEAYTGAEVLSLYTTHTVPAGKTPLGFYRCEERKGGNGSLGYNCVANTNHLVLTNITESTFHALDATVRYSHSNEKGHSKALNFDGSFAYASSPVLSLDLSSSWTITAKVKGDVSLSDIWGYGDGATTGFGLGYYLNQAMFNGVAVGPTLSAGNWYELTVVKSGGTVTLYVDGVSGGSLSTSSTATATSFRIGGAIYSGTPVQRGVKLINRVRIYNVAKSAGEVAAIYSGTNDTTGLLAHYNGQYDESGNGRNLTLVTGAAVVIIPAQLTDPTRDAAGNALGVTGPVCYPATVEVPCVTGDGSAAYVDLGSALIPATADFSLSLRYYHAVGNTTPRSIFDQRSSSSTGVIACVANSNGSGSANKLLIYLAGGQTIVSSVDLTPATWHLISVSRVGNLFTLSINGITTGTLTFAHTISITQTLTSLAGKAGASTFEHSDGRISDFRITTAGVTKYFFLAEGASRHIYWIASDGTSGKITNAIVNGTEATIRGQRCPYVQDPSILYGGSLGSSYGTELLGQVDDFSHAAWVKADVTVTANAIAAPSGAVTADLVTEGSAGTAIIRQTITGQTASVEYTASIYLKRGNTDWVRIIHEDGSSNGGRVWVNLATGAIGTANVLGTGSVGIPVIEPQVDGWYRVYLPAINGSTSKRLSVNSAAADNSGTRVNGATYYLAGGSLKLGGNEFVIGRIGSNLDANGNAKTLTAGKFGNPYARLSRNRWNAPKPVNIGITSSDSVAPSTNVQALSVVDTQFARRKADGSDRYAAYSPALTGTDKTNAQNYTA